MVKKALLSGIFVGILLSLTINGLMANESVEGKMNAFRLLDRHINADIEAWLEWDKALESSSHRQQTSAQIQINELKEEILSQIRYCEKEDVKERYLGEIVKLVQAAKTEKWVMWPDSPFCKLLLLTLSGLPFLPSPRESWKIPAAVTSALIADYLLYEWRSYKSSSDRLTRLKKISEFFEALEEQATTE